MLGADEFVPMLGGTRDVLISGSFLNKNVPNFGLPGGIHRWLQGQDASEEVLYPIATVESALKPLEKALRKVEKKGMC